MKKIKKSVEQWLRFVGKDKLQTFQDNFAKIYGVSMFFLDMKGYHLTVDSQNSLFCMMIENEQPVNCQKNFQADKESMKEEKPFVHICPFGIACLYVPVFFNSSAIAYAAVGGMVYENNSIPEKIKERYHISTYSKEKIQEIMTLLDSILRLFDMNTLLNNDEAQVEEDFFTLRMRADNLNKRECEIIRLICKGCSNKEIGRQLFISSATVKTYISNILVKLNLQGRMQIMARYYDEFRAMDKNDNEEEGSFKG